MKTINFTYLNKSSLSYAPSPSVVALKAQRRHASVIISQRNENSTTLRLKVAQ